MNNIGQYPLRTNSLALNTKTSSAVSDLPPELLVKIQSFLSSNEISSTTTVNKVWENTSLYAAKKQEIARFHEFLNFLIRSLSGKHETHKEKLGDLFYKNTPTKTLTLPKIKKDLLKPSRNRVYNILKTLPYNDIHALKAACASDVKPYLFHNIFKALEKHIAKEIANVHFNRALGLNVEPNANRLRNVFNRVENQGQ